MNKKIRYIIALILILIVCWLGYTHTEEINKISNTHKPFKQQFQRFIWLLSVGVLTWWAFLKDSKKWLNLSAIFIYGIVAFIFGIMGVIEWKYKILGENVKELIAGIRLFLSSPLPFIFLWILSSVNFDNLKKN